MSSPQDKVNAAAGKTSLAKRGLHDQLRAPTVLRQVADVHPLLATLPPAKREAAAMRLTQIAYSAATKNSALMRCSATSIVRGVVEAAQLGLTVDGVQGHAYLVPYGQDAQLQIGYRGFVAMAYRSDRVERIAADVVCEHDDFDYEEGTAATLRHKIPLRGERGAPIAVYALCQLKNTARPLFIVMRIDEVEKHRDRSSGWKAYKAGKIRTNPWETDFDAMAKKTALRMLAKWMPIDDVQRAGAADEQVDQGVEGARFVAATVSEPEPEPEAVSEPVGNGELTEEEERAAFGSQED